MRLLFASLAAASLAALAPAPAAAQGAHGFGAPDSAPPRGRSIPARMARTARHFAGDVWLVVSSPARLNRHGAVRLAAVLAAGGALYAFDEELLDASLRNRDDPVWGAIQDVGSFVEPIGFMGRTNPYYIGAAAAGYLFDVRPLREIPMQILESHMIMGGLRNSMKTLLGRRRPFEGRGPYHFELNGGTSFPSGHTSVMFELATILSHHARSTPVTVILYTLASAGALERVHTRAHWPSDLVLSAVGGTLVARTVIQRHEQRAAALHTGFAVDGDGTLRWAVTLPLGAPHAGALTEPIPAAGAAGSTR